MCRPAPARPAANRDQVACNASWSVRISTRRSGASPMTSPARGAMTVGSLTRASLGIGRGRLQALEERAHAPEPLRQARATRGVRQAQMALAGGAERGPAEQRAPRLVEQAIG